MRKLGTAAAVALALAVPAAAEGATYFNGDAAHGAYVIGTASHLDTVQVFCSGGDTFSNRELRFDVAGRVGVSKHKFSYSGTGYRYGPQGERRER
jgi:opacity protein-like surface antigen